MHIHVAFATYLTAFYLTELYVRTCRIPEEAQLSSHKVNYLSQHRPAHKLNWVSSPMLTFAIEFTNICTILSKSKTKKPMLLSYSAFYQTKLSQTYYSVSEVES